MAGKGFAFGCSAADYDDDGDLDLLVSNYGPDELYRNNGDGTFTDVSEKSGLARPALEPARACGSTTTATAPRRLTWRTTWSTTAASSALLRADGLSRPAHLPRRPTRSTATTATARSPT